MAQSLNLSDTQEVIEWINFLDNVSTDIQDRFPDNLSPKLLNTPEESDRDVLINIIETFKLTLINEKSYIS